jgi:hypothetical protein
MAVKVTDEMVRLFGQAWGEENAQSDGFSMPGDRRRAGLGAVLNGLDPEAKRGLASELLASADECEGRS